jgi:hypothetical protein
MVIQPPLRDTIARHNHRIHIQQNDKAYTNLRGHYIDISLSSKPL